MAQVDPRVLAMIGNPTQGALTRGFEAQQQGMQDRQSNTLQNLNIQNQRNQLQEYGDNTSLREQQRITKVMQSKLAAKDAAVDMSIGTIGTKMWGESLEKLRPFYGDELVNTFKDADMTNPEIRAEYIHKVSTDKKHEQALHLAAQKAAADAKGAGSGKGLDLGSSQTDIKIGLQNRGFDETEAANLAGRAISMEKRLRPLGGTTNPTEMANRMADRFNANPDKYLEPDKTAGSWSKLLDATVGDGFNSNTVNGELLQQEVLAEIYGEMTGATPTTPTQQAASGEDKYRQLGLSTAAQWEAIKQSNPSMNEEQLFAYYSSPQGQQQLKAALAKAQ